MEQECLELPECKQNEEIVDGILAEFDNQTEDTGDKSSEICDGFLSELDNIQPDQNIDGEDGDFLKELENFDPEYPK